MTWKIMRNSPIMQFREMKTIEGKVCMGIRGGSNHSSHRIFYKGIKRRVSEWWESHMPKDKG